MTQFINVSQNITKAQIYCVGQHGFQVRKYTHVPYWVHPMRVANLVQIGTNNELYMVIALLHDVIEDTDATWEDIEALFGTEVADGVKSLTNTSKRDFPQSNRAERKRIDIKRMSGQSPYVKFIKYCDRYDNINDLYHVIPNISKIPTLTHGFIYMYLQESLELLNALDIPEYSLVNEKFFKKYNLKDLIEKCAKTANRY